MFEALVEHLEMNVDKLISGKTLFINQMPAGIQLGLMLKSGYGGTTIDGELAKMRRAKFQLVGRGSSYTEVKELLDEATAFMKMANVRLGDYLIFNMRPLSEPFSYALSPGNNVEFSVNFSAVYGIVG